MLHSMSEMWNHFLTIVSKTTPKRHHRRTYFSGLSGNLILISWFRLVLFSNFKIIFLIVPSSTASTWNISYTRSNPQPKLKQPVLFKYWQDHESRKVTSNSSKKETINRNAMSMCKLDIEALTCTAPKRLHRAWLSDFNKLLLHHYSYYYEINLLILHNQNLASE